MLLQNVRKFKYCAFCCYSDPERLDNNFFYNGTLLYVVLYYTTSVQSETFCVALNDDTYDNDNYIYYIIQVT